MSEPSRQVPGWLVASKRLTSFIRHALLNFIHNRGILLAGGVGYNILLSIIPLLALLCVLLTHLVDEQRLMEIIAVQASHLAPAHTDMLVQAIRSLLDSRELISWVGMAALLFFSSFAFRMLEDSIGIIFHQHETPNQRSMWVSMFLPYAFMLVIGTALLILSLLISAAQSLNELYNSVFDHPLPLAGASSDLLNIIGFLSLFGLFSAIYKIMPLINVAPRRALIGGFVAALLWEAVRLGLAFYLVNISFVNAVYGSMATLIILLISLEVGAGILLFGAQIIAELEYNARAGLSWHGQAA